MIHLEDLFQAQRVLVLGIGGGGDIVGCIPTRDLLQAHDVDVLLGGLTWERVPHDPQPGPRSLEEINDHTPISDTVTWCHPGTRTHNGATFAESIVAETTGEDTLLLDINRGPAATARGLAVAMEELGIDHVVGLDAGGDVLAQGHEPGIRSPLADAVTLSALTRLDPTPLLGVVGWGSDGELTPRELEASYARIAQAGGLRGAWGMTPSTMEALRPILAQVPTEASRIPWESALGEVRERTIREGRRSLHVGAWSHATMYLDAGIVAEQSHPAKLVHDAQSVEEADEALLAEGYRTEYAYEREWVAEQEDGAPPEPT